METEKMAKQMVDFYKSTYDNSYNAMVMVQEQMERGVRTMLDQATWLPEEGRKVLDEWLKAYKQGREELKKTVEENYKKVEEFFVNASKAGK
jgi:hypothetical protein